MSRGGALGFQLAAGLIEAAVIQGIALLMPRTPAEFINIPNRQYWLAPERRQATLDWLVSLVLVIGCVMMVFWLWIFALIMRVNTSTGALRLSAGVPAGALLAAIAVVIVVTLRRFRRAS